MAYKHLTFQDRQKLAKLYGEDVPVSEIGRLLGIHRTTIYRELERGYTGGEDKNHRPGYDPVKGQQSASSGFRRRGPKKEAKAG